MSAAMATVTVMTVAVSMMPDYVLQQAVAVSMPMHNHWRTDHHRRWRHDHGRCRNNWGRVDDHRSRTSRRRRVNHGGVRHINWSREAEMHVERDARVRCCACRACQNQTEEKLRFHKLHNFCFLERPCLLAVLAAIDAKRPATFI